MSFSVRPSIKSGLKPLFVATVACALALMGSPSWSNADPTTYLQITAVNGGTVALGGEDVYDDPYYGNFGPSSTGSVPPNQTATLFCDDFLHDISVPSTVYPVTVETLANLTGVRFTTAPEGGYGDAGASITEQQAYDAAAELVYEMESGLISDVTGSSALWAIFDPAVIGTNSWSGTQGTADQTALSNALSMNFAGWPLLDSFEIFTPPAGEGQEFFYYMPSGSTTSITVTPEPSSLVLIGLGLFMVVAIIRRRTTGTEKPQFISAI